MKNVFQSGNIYKLVMRTIIMVCITMISFSQNTALAQNVSMVKGTVLSVTGEPLIGVAVQIKGTSEGTITDIDGNYVLMNVQESAIIVYSYMGMKTKEISLNGRSILNVTLEDDVQQLEQVVVVGYGSVKKGDLTGSVTGVKMSKIETVGNDNSVFTSLQGRVPGLQVVNSSQDPGASPSFFIRGVSSLNGTKSPLVVVDGFPLGEGADLKQIIPSEIASINILKDASSTSIYGSRGANGVIMITTKKAKEGKANISFSQQTIISQFSSKLNIWRNPVLMAQLDNESRINANQDPFYIGEYNNGVYYPSIEEIQSGKYPVTRWDDEVLRTPITTNYTLSINGATDKLSYNLAFSYYKDKGAYINDSFDKIMSKLDLNYKIMNNLTLRTSNVLSRDKRKPFSADIYRNPLYPVYDENGDYFKANNEDYYNPIALANTVKNETSSLDLFSSWVADWQIIEMLKLTAQLNYKYSTTITDQYFPKKYTADGNLNGGHAHIGNWFQHNVLPEIYLTFDKNWDNGSHLNIVGGYSYNSTLDRSSTMDAYDFTNEILNNENMSAGNPERNQIGNGYSESELVSYYGKVNYSLLDKYLFTVTFRSDGSSKFGKNNKWGYFPSGALAWKLHNEEFMKSLTFISEAKLRASYGISGNQGISPYQTLSRYGTEQYYSDGKWNTAIGPGYVIGYYGADWRFKYWGGVPNYDLKWETTGQFNLGLDMSFLNNRIRFVFDWYHKYTSDLLRQKYLPLSSGYDKMWVNDGEVLNKGFEISLEADIIRNNDMDLNMAFVFSHNDNEVKSLGNAASSKLNTDAFGLQYEFTGTPLTNQPVGTANILGVGQPINAFYGYKVDGIIQSDVEGILAGLTGDLAKAGEFKYRDLNGDGIIDTQDRTVIGDPNPDFTASLNVGFRYKNFDCSVFFNGVFGNDVLFVNQANMPSTMPLRWTVDNPNNDYPSLRANRQAEVSDWFIHDGSFVRIQNVSLGYTFKNIPFIQSLRLAGNINDLFTFTSFKGYDPEVGMDGLYWGGYPRLRKYTISLNLTF